MKRLIYYTAVILLVASGCKKADYLVYDDIARVQLSDTAALNSTFVYEAAAVIRDTVYIQVNTIGGITAFDRPVRLQQVPEYDYTYVRDPITNQVTDTIATVRPFTAKPGVHYVDFNDKAMASLMVVKANQVTAQMPVILLRDTSLKTNTYRLRVQLQADEAFGLGESKALSRTIVFSDRLERFYSWRVDNTSATAYNTFGRYSTGKHQFMIDVIKANIDEVWFQAALSSGALTHYKNYVKTALNVFNQDPANIASGKAPLRETSDPSSPLVTFP